MPKQSTTEQLRSVLLKYEEQIDVSEALELLDLLQDSIIDQGYLIDEQRDTIIELKRDLDNINTEISNQPELTKVNLGLDTIYYYLDKSNLQIRQELENALKKINKIPNSEILF